MSTSSSRARDYTSMLAKRAKECGFNPYSLSDETGIPYASAHKLMHGKMRQIPLDTAMKVAQAVGWQFDICFNPERSP